MKAALFSTTIYRDGSPLFEAGKHYPLTPETERQILRGHAKEIDVKAEAEKPEPPAKKAKAK